MGSRSPTLWTNEKRTSARRGGNDASALASDDRKPMLQTSVSFPRAPLKRARIQAATDKVSLQALLISALAGELDRRDKLELRRQARLAGSTPRRNRSPHRGMPPETRFRDITGNLRDGRYFRLLAARSIEPWQIDRYHDNSSAYTADSAASTPSQPSSTSRCRAAAKLDNSSS